MQRPADMQPLAGSDPAAGTTASAVPPNPSAFAHPPVASGGCSCRTCPTCAANQMTAPFQFVYAIGTVVPRLPNLGLEKEIAQSIGRAKPGGLSDEEALIKLLADPDFSYIGRE